MPPLSSLYNAYGSAISFVLLVIAMITIEVMTVDHVRAQASCPGGQTFSNVARVKATLACSTDYSRIDNCFNRCLPPAPSIQRSVSMPILGGSLPIDLVTAPYPRFNSAAISTTSGKTVIFPVSRGSNDSRLVLSARDSSLPNHRDVEFRVFRPENVSYDSAQRPSLGALSNAAKVHPLIYTNPINTNLAYKHEGQNYAPRSWQNTICDDSSSAVNKAGSISNLNSPRSCQANYTAGSALEDGDCYDITLVSHVTNLASASIPYEKWEPRSVDLTVFVRYPKSNLAGGGLSDIWIYPRNTATVLPPYEDYVQVKSATVNYPYNPSHPRYSNHLAQIVDDQCIQSQTPPKWCEYFDVQFFRSSGYTFDYNCNNVEDPGEHWDGSFQSATRRFFEPATTADGRLIIVNAGPTLAYSYTSGTPCHWTGWRFFKPVSCMPWDNNITQNYDIGKSQLTCTGPCAMQAFRDPFGNNIPKGQFIAGAYPWIDREGKNLFFSYQNKARDHYTASNTNPPGLAPDPDIKPGKMVSMLGAWTRGKIVTLDNGFNYSDFGGPAGDLVEFELPLYENLSIWTRPKASRSIFSAEQTLNYFEAMTPAMPFDIVWKLSSDTQRNVEVAFDEYLMDSAFVVAHMNAPIEENVADDPFPKDGFVATDPSQEFRFGGNPLFYFKENPLLQNAATTHPSVSASALRPPSSLRIRGGARIEPLGLGGVLGKGVYLDGYNDHFDMGFQNAFQNNSDWFFGAWLDSRESDPTAVRTVFFFPDLSWIGISQDRILTFNSSAGAFADPYKEIQLNSVSIPDGKYFHFGVKIVTKNAQRKLSFFINGTKLNLSPRNIVYPVGGASPPFDDGFSMEINYLGGQSWFLVGDPGTSLQAPNDTFSPRKPFKGWVDEFRIHALGNAEKSSSNYFDEFICNLALGTLTRVYKKDSDKNHPLLSKLYTIAENHGLFVPLKSGLLPLGPFGLDPSATSGESSSELELGTSTHGGFGNSVPSEPSAPSGGASPLDPTSSFSFTGPDFVLRYITPKGLVCEQMKLETYYEPRDFPPQAGETLCLDKVHRNPDPTLGNRCVRRNKLGINTKPLQAGQPRPNFATTKFCLSCHNPQQTISGLSPTALAYQPTVNREQDQRRQPLDVPGIMGGCLPWYTPFNQAGTGCPATTTEMDWLFDYNPKALL